MTLRNGGIRIFRVLGIQVYLHWSWAIIAFIELKYMPSRYHSPVWALLEYLAVFTIVLLHEFGHSLACRSVGGAADTIMLWPLGGVAYVSPPPRAGAMLWSIVAGPLVNVVLVPLTIGAALLVPDKPWVLQADPAKFVIMLAYINGLLLIFNVLPIYPLDGGKILWSVLWFVIGRWRALLVASMIGLIGGLAAIAGAFSVDRPHILNLYFDKTWLVVMAVFAASNAWRGFQQARQMVRLNSGPKHRDYACPACGTNPPMAALWGCTCGAMYDTFATGGSCPSCGSAFPTTQCTSCGARYPITQWYKPAFPVTMTNTIPTTTFTVPPPMRGPRL